ncbi:MAG: hypothetical protein AAB544_04875, partial [Patescibacteria group bacterium]
MDRLSRLRTIALLGATALLVTIVHASLVGLTVQQTEAQDTPACSDGIDNDHDGWIDYPGDGGCEGILDEDEIQGIYADRSDEDQPEFFNVPPL